MDNSRLLDYFSQIGLTQTSFTIMQSNSMEDDDTLYKTSIISELYLRIS